MASYTAALACLKRLLLRTQQAVLHFQFSIFNASNLLQILPERPQDLNFLRVQLVLLLVCFGLFPFEASSSSLNVSQGEYGQPKDTNCVCLYTVAAPLERKSSCLEEEEEEVLLKLHRFCTDALLVFYPDSACQSREEAHPFAAVPKIVATLLEVLNAYVIMFKDGGS